MVDKYVSGWDVPTPVETRGGYLFKRDDLFRPFAGELYNGGKVRQCLDLLHKNRERIHTRCNHTVMTVSSVHSPQGGLVTRCAHSMGMRCVIGVGNTTPDKAVKYPAMKEAVEKYGAEIRKISGIGYNTVLNSRLVKICNENLWFPVRFGIEGDLDVNASQVANLPDDLDHLVIPCGSGGSASAILKGLSHRHIHRRPERVWVVQIAGMNRTLGWPYEHHFIKDETYPYSKRVKIEYEGVSLDEIYEAKAFDWLLNSTLHGKTLFWVIANFNGLR